MNAHLPVRANYILVDHSVDANVVVQIVQDLRIEKPVVRHMYDGTWDLTPDSLGAVLQTYDFNYRQLYLQDPIVFMAVRSYGLVNNPYKSPKVDAAWQAFNHAKHEDFAVNIALHLVDGASDCPLIVSDYLFDNCSLLAKAIRKRQRDYHRPLARIYTFDGEKWGQDEDDDPSLGFG